MQSRFRGRRKSTKEISIVLWYDLITNIWAQYETLEVSSDTLEATKHMPSMRATTLSILDLVFLPCFLQNITYTLSPHNWVNPPFFPTLRFECSITSSYCAGHSKCYATLCCFVIKYFCLTLIFIEWLFAIMGLFSSCLLFDFYCCLWYWNVPILSIVQVRRSSPKMQRISDGFILHSVARYLSKCWPWWFYIVCLSPNYT